MKGYFISVEGSDGSGKSTQLKNIVAYLERIERDMVVTREPGGTPLSEKIRDLLLDPENKEMTSITEMLLYAAARAQHVEEKIIPALGEGKVVLTDRFVDSSVAYQGYGRGLGDVVWEVNKIATAGVMPDLTIFLDLPYELGIERKKNEEGHVLDRLELQQSAFHKRVYNGYLEVCKKEGKRIQRIDASKSPEDVFLEIEEVLNALFGLEK